MKNPKSKKKKRIVFFRIYCLRPYKWKKKVKRPGELYCYGVHSVFNAHGATSIVEAIEQVRPHLKDIVPTADQKNIMAEWKAWAEKRKFPSDGYVAENFWQFACEHVESNDGVIPAPLY